MTSPPGAARAPTERKGEQGQPARHCVGEPQGPPVQPVEAVAAVAGAAPLVVSDAAGRAGIRLAT
jgi:hypothetical protein